MQNKQLELAASINQMFHGGIYYLQLKKWACYGR